MLGTENVEIVGISDGYYGLIHNICKEMSPDDFSGILTRGGTILGTKRQPFKMMKVIGDDNVDKVKNMKKTYQAQKLDCLLTLGGNGTHKTSKLLADEGLNVIGLPKTIDNDIYGTDVTFGFHTAVDIATDALGSAAHNCKQPLPDSALRNHGKQSRLAHAECRHCRRCRYYSDSGNSLRY